MLSCECAAECTRVSCLASALSLAPMAKTWLHVQPLRPLCEPYTGCTMNLQPGSTCTDVMALSDFIFQAGLGSPGHAQHSPPYVQ